MRSHRKTSSFRRSAAGLGCRSRAGADGAAKLGAGNHSGICAGCSGAASFALSAMGRKSIVEKGDCACGAKLLAGKPQAAIDGGYSLLRQQSKAGRM